MSRSTRGPRGMLFLVVGMALSSLVSTRVNAVPAFSRKYQTSCQTCHSIFPKLNPFGTAFRLNGYHLPGETEEQVKQKPVSLGADAYERIWPKMVYPSTLPGNAPLRAERQDGGPLRLEPRRHRATDHPQRLPVPAGGESLRGGHARKSLQLLRRSDVRRDPGRRAEVEIEHARLDFVNRRSARSTSSTSDSESWRRTPGTDSRKCGS